MRNTGNKGGHPETPSINRKAVKIYFPFSFLAVCKNDPDKMQAHYQQRKKSGNCMKRPAPPSRGDNTHKNSSADIGDKTDTKQPDHPSIQSLCKSMRPDNKTIKDQGDNK